MLPAADEALAALGPQLLLGLLGLALWRTVVAPRLPRPGAARSSSRLLPAWLLALAVQFAGGGLLLATLAPGHGRVPLSTLLAASLGGNLAAAVVILWMARRHADARAALRLAAPSPLVGLLAVPAAWLALLPLVGLAQVVSQAVFAALDIEPERQDALLAFAKDPAARTLWAWLAIVLLIPACEEFLFRGALYRGLRRALRPLPAMLLSGLFFGLLHEPVAAAQVAALGVGLAWLAERSGGLLLPILVHAFQNALTLVIASHWPELLP